ncbi:putative RNA-directed DNA polymerase [Tanacetum coccineum]
MDPGTRLTKITEGTMVNSTEYRSLIGCLRYLLHTRPDLSYYVGLLSRFMQEPREQHMKAIRQVLRYVKGTKDHGITYKHNGGNKIHGYSDSSYGVNTQEGKGTTGIIFYYGESPISWSTQKQATVALSSCESEFIAATQALWLKRLLSKLTHTQEEKITIQVDNKSAIALMKNLIIRSNILEIVYALQDYKEKKMLWKALTLLINRHDSFSIILGDFNEVRHESKRRVTVFDPRGASKFNDFIASSGLCDLPIGGKRFTCMNSLGTKLSKIDRVLVSHHFLIKWPNSHVLALPREYSDHSPLLLSITTPDYGPTPFKLYNSWINHTEFPSLVHDSWVITIIEQPLSLAVVLKVKLQNLKRKIKQWHLTVTRLDSAVSSELRQKIDILDTKAETTPLSSSDVITRTEFVKLLADIDHRKLKDLRQKAKVKWAVEGDENSNFFHGIINTRRNKSKINGLNIHGELVTEPATINNHIFNFFSNRFKEDNLCRPTFTSNLFKHLSSDDVNFLESPFTSLEIKDADLLGNDVVSYVKEFETSAHIPRVCNSSFITLVPKVDDPLVIGDFRPISLIGCQYKIIAKVLANRNSKAKKHKKRLMFFKVDFEKAFDSLSWSFLFSILDQMGFSLNWRNWIHACLKSAFALVLVNGSPTKEFKLKKGLRQGDPLSHFLFIIAVEALNVALLEATNNNIFHGIKLGKDNIPISHLQFADDAFIMGSWSLINAKNLSRILTCFHLASGLKVNFSKSKRYGIGVSNHELSSLASKIRCLASQFPCIYLGLPIGAKMSRCLNWNPLIDRFYKCLSKWKSKTLSFGGRLTLLKSVLGSLGVYYFSTFKAPKNIISKLEGGLGIGSLKASNHSLLAKWWWRFLNEDNALWSKVIHSIHGPMGGLFDNTPLKYTSAPWLDTNRNCHVSDRCPTVMFNTSPEFFFGPTVSDMGLVHPPGLVFR